jgi:hypothetical protein
MTLAEVSIMPFCKEMDSALPNFRRTASTHKGRAAYPEFCGQYGLDMAGDSLTPDFSRISLPKK